MFLLNSWLADGLLVSFVFNSSIQVSNLGRRSSRPLGQSHHHRLLVSHIHCLFGFVHRFIPRFTVALLVNPSGTAIGIVTRPADLSRLAVTTFNFGVPYYSISFASMPPTLMIVVRLVMFNRRIRNCQENGYFHTHFCDHFFELFTYPFLSLFPAQ